ncbi:MAG: tRNA dihydrouridine synthase DusB [Shimia sp.]
MTETTHPIVALAPLAGITDLPFRSLVQSFGADFVVSEMVASQEMVQARPGTREKAELGTEREGTAVQLAGREANWMAEAARVVEGQGATCIDINMGCPAKKVTSGYSGAALLQDLDHALTLIEAVVGAVSVPVTLKTRLGWDERLMTAPTLARRAEAAGISRLVIHGRTRCQFYKGRADWGAIREVVEAVDIPVLANGDITDITTAHAALAASGAAGIMVGRGAQGRPWLLRDLRAALRGERAPAPLSADDFLNVVSSHYEAILTFYGKTLGTRVARKHLGWYMDQAKTGPVLRKALLTAHNPAEVAERLPDALAPCEVAA